MIMKRTVNILILLLCWIVLAAQNDQMYPVVKDAKIRDFEIRGGIYGHAFTLSNREKWPIK